MTPRDDAQGALPARAGASWYVLNAAIPMWVAAGQLDLSGDGGRDASVIRTLGLGYAGGFRALDVWFAALFAWVPLGTRALRAELSGVLLVGLMATLLFALVRRSLLARRGDAAWSSVVATLATATVACSYPFQREATSAGSCLLGVVLVLAAIALGEGGKRGERGRNVARLAAFVLLAVSYEPLVGACVAAALGVHWALRTAQSPFPPIRGKGSGLGGFPRLQRAAPLALGAAAGATPFLLAAVQSRTSSLSTSVSLFAWPAGSGFSLADASLRHAAALVDEELGSAMMLLALGGVVLAVLSALISARARRETLPLVAVTAVALVVVLLGGGGGRDTRTPVALVLLLGVTALAGIAMHEIVVRVARARLPLASGSAAMVIVLFAAFPAMTLDEGLARASVGPPLGLPTWEDSSFRGLPSGSLILVSSPRLYARMLATRASGDMPGDVLLLPTFDPKNEASAHALARDARLVPLFRDIALTGVPEELSLSTLAVERPLAVTTDPRWDRSLTRHLLPGGLLALFAAEPRGGADRKHALEASAPARARLATALSSASLGTLASLTTSLLLDRALAAVQTSEHEVAAQALADAATFAPKDARIARLIARQTSGAGGAGGAREGAGSADVRGLLSAGLALSTE